MISNTCPCTSIDFGLFVTFWIEEGALRAALARLQEQGIKSDGTPLVG
jgi:hypothetical protein